MTTRNDSSGNDQSDFSRRDFLKGGVAAGVIAGGGLGAFYFGYDQALGKPLRVGVIGTGDEGSVLIGALNPKFLEVRSIADIRPYNVHRALHGEIGQPVRPGLMNVYGWKNEAEALRHVKVYGPWQDLLDNARKDGLEGVIIALPLFLHAPVAIAAMKRGLHVLTEKLMGHSVHECKEMALASEKAGKLLATGHQRHYNILYAQAAEKIKRGLLGDLHYIRAQWHRSNLPGKDSWQQPLPPGVKGSLKDNELAKKLESLRKDYEKLGDLTKATDKVRGTEMEQIARQIRQLQTQIADRVLHNADKAVLDEVLRDLRGTAAGQIAEAMALKAAAGRSPAVGLGYEDLEIKHSGGVYERPALEELIRWRLWDRTAAGLMAELGSHQLDAASIFITAAHARAKGEGVGKVHPLSVAAAGNRPIFPPDRDCEDHVYCILEFPAPDYDPKDPNAARKKIGVMYSSINGNGFGGYGEVVFGTKGTLILEREQVMHEPQSGTAIKVSSGGSGPTLDTQSSGPARALAASGSGEKISRGYAEELEHWAWCIRNPSPEHQPRCHPKVAMGDAVIALVTNMAARKGQRIEFEESWFDPHSPETPEKIAPDLSRYENV